MTEFIKSQISDEIFFKISELENEKNKSKQNKIAKEIISELDIEDFRPYMAYDLEGNAFIALNYYYSSNGIDECLMTGNHDATITEDGVYIDDESFLETLKIGYLREELLILIRNIYNLFKGRINNVYGKVIYLFIYLLSYVVVSKLNKLTTMQKTLKKIH